MTRDDELFKSEMTQKLGAGMTDRMLGITLDAYHRRPSHVLVLLERSVTARDPQAYFFSACSRIVDESPAPPKPKAVRHDMDAPACRDCGDSGFVTLIRDIPGSDAFAGDAAPCHCATGVEKQKRYGTVHYGREDYEPVLPDADAALVSLREYAQSEARRTDPNLESMRTVHASSSNRART
jgi:hypothetical protein